jgi:hypothetical protein
VVNFLVKLHLAVTRRIENVSNELRNLDRMLKT